MENKKKRGFKFIPHVPDEYYGCHNNKKRSNNKKKICKGHKNMR